MKRAIMLLLLSGSLALAGQRPQGVNEGCAAGVTLPTLCEVIVGETMNLPAGWRLAAAADYNGDGYPDFVLTNDKTGEIVIWFMKPYDFKK